jgi:hypothetical protein
MLTPQQIAFFETFGYLHLPQALAAEIGWIQDEFEAAWKARPDVKHDGSQRTIFPASFITARPRLSTLVEHPVVCGALDDLLGAGWSSYGGDGNFYSGDTAWHSDCGATWWPAKTITRHITVAFYLDHLTRETGALRVIPGSHHHGDAYARLLEEQVPSMENGPLAIHGRDVPAVSVDIVPGDLAIFDHRLKHASYGGGNRRRMFTINNFAPCRTEEQREAARFILRHYRDNERVNWLGREGWLDWIETLTPVGRRNHQLVIELGREVMEELTAAR